MLELEGREFFYGWVLRWRSGGKQCVWQAPNFGGEETGEGVVGLDEGEAGGGKGSGMVGEAGGAEAGEETEGEVEASDEGAGDGVDWAVGGDAEVGQEPESARLQVRSEGLDEGFEVGLGETVEEEVGDDEVVAAGGEEGAGEGEGIGVVGLQAGGCGGMGGVAASFEQVEHAAAGVDCVYVDGRVGGE